MKEKLAKKEFIKNFEYFKRNVQEYDKKRDPKYYKICMFLIAPFIVMLAIFAILPLFLTPHWYLYLMVIYAAVTIPLILIMMVIFEFKNMKAITFDNMVYKGKLSDLFKDTNHPEIIKAQHLIKMDMDKKGGISGHTAYYLYEEMNKPEYAVKTEDLKSADEKIIMAIDPLEKEDTTKN